MIKCYNFYSAENSAIIYSELQCIKLRFFFEVVLNVPSDIFGIKFQGNGYAMEIICRNRLIAVRVKRTTTHV